MSLTVSLACACRNLFGEIFITADIEGLGLQAQLRLTVTDMISLTATDLKAMTVFL